VNRQDLDRHLQNHTAPRAMALFGESHNIETVDLTMVKITASFVSRIEKEE